MVDRAGQAELDLKTHVLNQAIATIPKLTRQQRAGITVIFAVRCTRYTGPFDLSAFYEYLARYLVPFVADIPESSSDYGYMEYAGIGSFITFSENPLAMAYQDQACGFFLNGFTRDAAPGTWSPFLDDPEVFMPCLRDPQRLQIRARSMHGVEQLAKAKGIPALITHVSICRMQPAEIRADMISHVPSLEMLFDKWGDHPRLGATNFQPNAAGIAIGHACQRKAVGEMGSLDSFLL